jgi:hypothetical protein
LHTAIRAPTPSRTASVSKRRLPCLGILRDWTIGWPQDDGSSVAAIDARTHPDALGCQVL